MDRNHSLVYPLTLTNLTDAPDLSPRPLFSQHNVRGHASSMWNLQHRPWDREAYAREHAQVIQLAKCHLSFLCAQKRFIWLKIAVRNVSRQQVSVSGVISLMCIPDWIYLLSFVCSLSTVFQLLPFVFLFVISCCRV